MYNWISLNSSAELAVIEQLLSPEYDPKRVAKKLVDGISDAVKNVLVEYNYIDKDYRSTYYNLALFANPVGSNRWHAEEVFLA
ncbi:MAG: hypothetical protein PHV02_07870 [Rhodocyclaceae bacterium]|nr:hypothetical protein [Rhodocyclaceae bacterium]